MKKISGLLLSAIVLAFTACKSHDKKILVYASGDIQADNTKTNITVSDGTTHHEQELDFPGNGPVTLNVQASVGKLSLTAADDGYYIANFKNDTVVGSYQHVGTDNGSGRLSQEGLKHTLDSLQKLIIGQNVSEANRNYFIPPGKMVKITAESKAKVFGPFTTIPGSFDAGSVPEIYKFYTIKEVREIIGNLQKMASPEPADKKEEGADKK